MCRALAFARHAACHAPPMLCCDRDATQNSASHLFEPRRNCSTVARARRVATLIDAEDYFRTLHRAAELATESIIILAWDLNTNTRLYHDDSATGAPALLGDFLNYLVKRRRGLRVYALNWDYPMIFAPSREIRPLYGLGWKPRRGVKLRYDNTHPIGASQHQKLVVIDDSLAFCGGIDLTWRRWDTCKHQPDDHRRMADGAAYPPFHDVMAVVDGDLAAALGEVARTRWFNATRRRIPRAKRVHDIWPADLTPHMTDVHAAVSRTMPETPNGLEVREIEALYLDMIAAARRYLYLENQYFTSDTLGTALAARLSEADPPEIIVVTRLLSHGWLEENTMEVLRTRLVRRLRAADVHKRFQIYYPRVPGLVDGTCVDVHSKVAVVDDRWLRIGSANFANRSMGLDSECDVTFDAEDDPAKTAAVRGFRDTLLSEHLDVPLHRFERAAAESSSLRAAIESLRCDKRTLQVLEEKPEASLMVMSLASVADPERPVAMDRLIALFSSGVTARTSRGSAPWGKIAAIILALVGLALAWRYTPLADLITPEQIIASARGFGGIAWAPIAVAAAYVPASFTMFPRPLLTLSAVIAFGPWMGFAVAMTGIAGAAMCAFYAGQALRRDTVRRLAGKRLNRVSELLRKRGVVAAFVCSVAPVAPFVIVGMVAGAVRLKLWQYLAGTLAGMLPGTLATTVFGAELAAALEGPESINYWIMAGVVGVLGGLLFGARRWITSLEAGQPARHSAAAVQRA